MRKTIAICVVALLLGTASYAGAQVSSTGIVSGRVVDADGAALPGVQVVVEGPALIAAQTHYTGADGTFRVPLLPPGMYTVTFTLQGFATIVQEQTDVGVRRTTTVNASLQLSGVEETITVTGKSPLVDIKSTKRSTEVSDEFLNTLPETRGAGSDLMSLSPDATVPTGGNANSYPSFFGSSTSSNAFLVDGVNVTDPSGGSQFPFYSPDWFEVVEQTTLGADASMGKAMGSTFNVVTKSGGNSYHGEFNFYFANNSFISDNTQDIESSVADFTPAEIKHRYDFTMNIGGPVTRDKVWFFAGYQVFKENMRDPGDQVDQIEDSDRFFGKVTWQANQNNRVIVSAMADTYTLDGRPGGSRTAPEAAVDEPSMNITPNVTWNSVLTPDAFLEVKYSGFYGFFDLIPQTDAASYYDWGSGWLTEAYWGYYTYDRTRSSVQANLSYYAEDMGGDHSFKFGGEYERLVTDDQSKHGPAPAGSQFAGQNVMYYPYWGDLYAAYILNPQFNRNTSDVKMFTVYGQDDWTVADRLTLNLGIRWDHSNIGYIDSERPNMPVFNDISPRLGAVYDVMGDGRMSAHVFYGRFYSEVHGTIFDNFDPQSSVWEYWEHDGSQYQRYPSWDYNPGLGLSIDPNLKNAWSNQFTTGLDWQWQENLAMAFKYIHKYDSDVIGAADLGSTFVRRDYAASNGATVQGWAADPRDEHRVLVNNPNSQYVGDIYREYNGFQVKMNKRLSDGWQMQASYMIQKATGNTSNTGGGVLGSTSSFLTPNRFIWPDELQNSRRHVIKINGSYLMPDPIRVLIGARFDWASSGRYTEFERFSSSETGGLRSGDRTLPIVPRGSQTINPFNNLDLRFEKKFNLGGGWGDFGVVFDIFNVANSDGTRGIFTRYPNYGEITSIVSPREFRLGFRWLF